MESKKEKVKAFIDLLFKSNSEQRLVLVTSGGTSVRLEKNTVRSDSFPRPTQRCL